MTRRPGLASLEADLALWMVTVALAGAGAALLPVPGVLRAALAAAILVLGLLVLARRLRPLRRLLAAIDAIDRGATPEPDPAPLGPDEVATARRAIDRLAARRAAPQPEEADLAAAPPLPLEPPAPAAPRSPAPTPAPVLATGIATAERATTAAEDPLAERLDLVARGSRDGLFEWELDRGRAWFSPRFLDLVDRHARELDGDPRRWLAIVASGDLADLHHAIARHLAGEVDAAETILRVRRRDGSTIRLLCHGIADSASGGATRLAGSITDLGSDHETRRLATRPAAPDAARLELRLLPILCLETGVPDALEVLVRVRGDSGSLESLEPWIGDDEGDATLDALLRPLRGAALDALATWRSSGPRDGLRLHLNAAAGELARGLDAALLAELAARALPASAIRLEVRETALRGGAPATLQALDRLREAGVTIVLDDFGTGTTALDDLAALPIDWLKLDRRFLRRLDALRAPSALVRAVIEAAGAAGLATIAEGLETSAQVGRLQSVGCGLGQGHFFSEALTVEATTSFLAGDRADARRAA